MRESDTGLWLHNKLGATDELWAPPSIASLLTAAVIDNIRLCFHRLSSAVKLKLLLGTLHLPRRTVDEVRARASLSPAGAQLLPPSSTCAVPCPSPAGHAQLRVGAVSPDALVPPAAGRCLRSGVVGPWPQQPSARPAPPEVLDASVPKLLLVRSCYCNFPCDC